MKKRDIKEFPVHIYGNVEQYNNVLSKARCRIFYKYGNRNGTYITDEYAEKLIKSLPYTPVKAIYDGDDFEAHGQHSDGRIYGIVPENPNVTWEKHIDEDGIEREYACTDILLFSALYAETDKIVGKSQSMELYEPSIIYHMAVIDGQRWLVFDEGCFLGLQVLGDNVEPCFEGASFYTLQQSIADTIAKIKEYSKEEKLEMHRINFQISDREKFDAIWDLLNPTYNEENDWGVSYSICDIYDEYLIAFNYGQGSYERIEYTKNDETDTIELGSITKVYNVYVTENEKSALDTLRALNGGTYDLVSETLVNAEKNEQSCAEFSTKIEELNETIATLNTEVDNVNAKITETEAQYAAVQEQNSAFAEEVKALKNYKHAVETQIKETVIDEYADKLSEEVLDTYRAKFDEYTAEELDMHLAYELKKTNASVFSQAPTGRIPKDNTGMTGVEEILSRYKL